MLVDEELAASFFFEDLLASFARDNCSCCRHRIQVRLFTLGSWARLLRRSHSGEAVYPVGLTTPCSTYPKESGNNLQLSV